MNPSNSDTETLVCRAAGGDQAAVEALFVQHRGRLREMVRLRMDPRLQARVDPSDVIQETLMTASQQLPGYLANRPIPFYPWLRRIAWQTLIHHHERHLDAQRRSIRHEHRHGWGVNEQSTMEIVKLLAGGFGSPSAELAKKELRERVRAALEQLSDTDREVLLERYVEQLSIKEIAAVLELNEAAIYKRHARALERLHAILEREPS